MDYAVTDVHVDTAQARFAVRAVGNPGGPVVVALHGFADHPATFDALGRHLAAHGYVTVAPYLRGHAPSPLDGGPSLSAHAADLHALVDELSPDRPVLLIGHGEGAWVVHQALGRGMKAHKVVALGAAGPDVVQHLMRRDPRVAWSMRHVLLPRMGSWGRRRILGSDAQAITALWDRWSPGYRPPTEHMERIAATFRSSGSGPLGLLDLASAEPGSAVARESTLCLMGENDAAVPPHLLPGRHSMLTGRRSTLSGAHMRVLPGVGHFPHLEAPEVTFDAITQWFAQP